MMVDLLTTTENWLCHQHGHCGPLPLPPRYAQTPPWGDRNDGRRGQLEFCHDGHKAKTKYAFLTQDCFLFTKIVLKLQEYPEDHIITQTDLQYFMILILS